MNTSLEVISSGSVQALSADQLKAHVSIIQKAMKAVMKQNTHYGVIPGTNKPTLYKAGSEVLLTTFHIAVDPEVEDVSTADEVRYRVKAVGRHQTTNIIIGTGVGECSSSEEKYRWRNVVCEEEFNEAPEDRRRIKWQKGRDGAYQRKQIRTVPADVANTVLKMAKKRAQIDMTLTALAASDIFTQDVEDMPPEMRETMAEESENPAPPAVQTKPHTAPPQAKGSAAQGFATEKQLGLVRRRLDEAGLMDKDFLHAFELEDFPKLPFDKVDAALRWIKDYAP